jgi:uncharacterized protein (DUF2235 family)
MASHAEPLTKGEGSNAEAVPPARQRLAICLDGTWNKRESGTNVYQLSTLIARGDVGGGWVQDVYYDPGVGTGVLDGLTGGAFGIGLSQNVKDAYAWLVERYRDDDEVYVFGFSRGAFTARSLVGLIARCGLLERGAPIAIGQVWRGYRILGRYPDEKTGSRPAANWWERLFGCPERPFRDLWQFKRASWDDGPGPALRDPEMLTEVLLAAWSRRIRITCVGVFDTVGSMGLDALAIPFVRDHTAQFHSTQLSSLVLNGFQALAIDEHRANFVHIPWRGEPESSREGKTAHGGRIEQRWFIGAHADVGGGYENDVLARRPLAWLVEETGKLGLAFRDHPALGSGSPQVYVPLRGYTTAAVAASVPARASARASRVHDSFAEFSKGCWCNLVRSKREYRRIDPPPEFENGRLVQSLNETLDESVLVLQRENARCSGARPYLPPNLWEYLHRRGRTIEPAPRHRYVEGASSVVWLVAWLAGIAIAAHALGRLAALAGLLGRFWWVPAVVLPAIALLVDWRESVLGHQVAVEPSGLAAERKLAWLDVCLVVRLIGISFFVAGAVAFASSATSWLLARRLGRYDAGLLGVYLLALNALAAREWRGASVRSAGVDAIPELRRQRTPAGILGCLGRWAAEDPSGQGQRLMLVARSIWRDMFTLTPAWAAFLFAGTWLGFWVLGGRVAGSAELPLVGGLARTPKPWLWSAVLTAAWAGFSLVEDYCLLRYLQDYPKQPSAWDVRGAVVAGLLERLSFAVGLAISLAGIGGLAFVAVREALRGPIGIPSLFVVLLGASIVYVAVRDQRRQPTVEAGTGSVSTPAAQATK